MPGHRQESFDYEDVSLSVRILVQARRARGIKWEDSLKDVGQDLGVSWTMIRTVFYRFRDLSPTAHDWAALRTRIADYLEHEAEELIRQAEDYERKAAALRQRKEETCATAGSASRRVSAVWPHASFNGSSGD